MSQGAYSFFACSTHRPWSDANFDYISACQDQLLDHFACNDVSGDNRFVRPLSASSFYEVHEELRVPIGHIDAHILEQRTDLQDLIGLLEIGITRSRAYGNILSCKKIRRDSRSSGPRHQDFATHIEDITLLLGKCFPLIDAVVFMNAGESFVLKMRWRDDEKESQRQLQTLTLFRARATSNVPTVSMLAAMRGTPTYSWPEFRNLCFRTNSTFHGKQEKKSSEL